MLGICGKFSAYIFYMKKGLYIFLIIVFFLPVINSCAKKSYSDLSYDITAAYDSETNSVTATEKVTFVNKTDVSYKELRFNLYPAAYRKDSAFPPVSNEYKRLYFYDGESYGGITISSVKEKEKTLSFYLTGKDENVLAVKLDDELYYGDKITIEISFVVTIPKAVHRLGKNAVCVNLGNFYPSLCVKEKAGDFECEYYNIGDPFYSYSADYTVRFSCPDDYVCAFSGKTVSKTHKGKIDSYVVRINGIRDFAIVMSEKYKVKTEKVKDVEIFYYYINDENIDNKLSLIKRGLEFYGEVFGKYPYATYTVAETSLINGGMEYGAFAMTNCNDKDYKDVILHELAHQWWYGVVGNNQLTAGYIDEGLAEYSTILFKEFNEGRENRKNAVKIYEESYKTFCSVYDALKLGKDTSMNRHLSKYKTEYEYYELNYVKPVIMFDMARESVGDKAFFKSLKTLYTDNKFKICDFDSLCGAFGKVGLDMSGFFESFVSGKAVI